MSKKHTDSTLRDVVSGIDAMTGRRCTIVPCHLMDPGSFCAALDKAGVPINAKWRALIRFMRGIKDYYPIGGEDRIEFQNALVKILQNKNFSDAAYMQAVRTCRSLLMRPYEKVLQNAVDETTKLVDSFCNTITARRGDVTTLKDNTIATVTSGSSPDVVVEKLRVAFNKLSEAMQKDAESLQAMSYLDALSGVANRRAFDEAFARFFADWQSKQSPIAMIMADIDYFKRFNDTYGHRIGDQAIKTVATKMSKVLADYPEFEKLLFLARYGGEEFVILCTGAAAELAPAIAESCRASMEEYSFVIRDGKGSIREEGVQITISLGVAFAEEGFTPPMLLDAADGALYRAKETGRNRVTVA